MTAERETSIQAANIQESKSLSPTEIVLNRPLRSTITNRLRQLLGVGIIATSFAVGAGVTIEGGMSPDFTWRIAGVIAGAGIIAAGIFIGGRIYDSAKEKLTKTNKG